MNNISQYILEKLKIDKNIKLSNNQYYFLTVWYSDLYDKLANKYYDKLIKPVYPISGFFFNEEELNKFIESTTHTERLRSIQGLYKIPDEYWFESFKKDYMDHKIKLDDLEKVDIEKIERNLK